MLIQPIEARFGYAKTHVTDVKSLVNDHRTAGKGFVTGLVLRPAPMLSLSLEGRRDKPEARAFGRDRQAARHRVKA